MQADDPVVAHLAFVVAQPPGDARPPDLRHPVHRGGGGGDLAQFRLRQGHALKAVGIFLGDEGRGHVARTELRMIHHGRQERQVMPDPFHLERVERLAHPLDRLVPRRRPCAKLGDHRVVIHADLAALIDAGIVTHHARGRRRLDRRAVTGQPPDRGKEVPVRVLGIKPAFHRPAVDLQVRLGKGQLLAIRHPDHLFDQIDPGDQLRHRMFDLQTGIHFKEVEVAVAIDDELDRPR